MPRKLLNAAIIIVALVLLYVCWLNRYWFYDEYRLFGYHPPSAVVSIANQDELTPYARTLFYVYHPDLEDKTQFNQNCRVTNQAIVLGCTVIGRGIYLYNIKDPTLNGIEQVTAAYEMLHVAYSRLSTSERNKIDSLVIATYNKVSVNDPELRAEYQSYLKTEGQGAIDNEMHSTLGTEITNLPPALEQYYNKYFINRSVILSYFSQYQSLFTQRQQTVTTDDQKLVVMNIQIQSNEVSLKYELVNINDLQDVMNQYKNSGQYSNYNADVPKYNYLVDQYNQLIYSIQSLIQQYNQLVALRNSAAVSENKLTQEISSQNLSTLSP
ncbi:MAG TPA: hypothetical protein VMR76_01375 [Candidatus Saccharimonadia bacterium]|nr:hypothetical protein [Candidatus Saccharimonadia bacterium]